MNKARRGQLRILSAKLSRIVSIDDKETLDALNEAIEMEDEEEFADAVNLAIEYIDDCI